MNILKEHLLSAPILVYPDYNKPFILTVDGSTVGISAVLSQTHEKFDHPVAYLSRTLNKMERNYTTTEIECLACLYAMKAFRHYLISKRFTLVSDHAPLAYLNSINDPSSRLMRWILKFQDYEYDFKYKKGKLNINADALSRCPVGNPKSPNDKENVPQFSAHCTERIINEQPDGQVCVIDKKLDQPALCPPNATASNIPKCGVKPNLNPLPHRKICSCHQYQVYKREAVPPHLSQPPHCVIQAKPIKNRHARQYQAYLQKLMQE